LRPKTFPCFGLSLGLELKYSSFFSLCLDILESSTAVLLNEDAGTPWCLSNVLYVYVFGVYL